MDNIYNNSPYYTLANYYNYTLPEDYISPNSAAAQLGLTPADMAPILQEQYELMRDELAQPPPALTRSTTTYHLKARIETQPKPAPPSPQQEAARLGITPEDLAAISEEAVREQAKWLAKEAKWRSREEERWRGRWGTEGEHAGEEKGEETEETERREQREHETGRVRTPTTTRPRSASPPHVHPQSATAQLGLTPEEAEEVHYECIRAQDEIRREIEEEEQARREQKAEQDAHAHVPPPGHLAYGTENHGDTPVASSEHHGELDPQTEPDRNDTIGQLAYELGVPREAHLDWAEETDRVLGYTVQGEYLQTNYPAPAPSPPAPWYPPQPPTSDYPPPQTHYLPPHQQYSRQEPHYTPRRPRFHPRTHPHPKRRPRLENRTSHVTATRRARFRTTTRVERDGSPRYVPPALRDDKGTSRRSSLPNPGHSEGWRDPPPHKDPSVRSPTRSDSPNWRAPSPNRPISFKNPSPPPQSPTPSTSPLQTPETVRVPPRHHTQSQLTSELIGIIKTTSEALQSIVR